MKKTIRPILRDDLSRKGLEKRIDLRVYLDGRQTKFATPYSIAPACWDKKSGRVVGNCPEKSVINSYLNGNRGPGANPGNTHRKVADGSE